MKERRLTKYHSQILFGFKQRFSSLHHEGMYMLTVQTKSNTATRIEGQFLIMLFESNSAHNGTHARSNGHINFD